MSKIVFITGASSGIGKAIASRLSSKGFTVYGTSRHPQKADDYTFSYLQMDVRKEDEIYSAVQKVIEKEGRIDVLINNAGLGAIGALEDTSIEESKSIFETNVFGLHAYFKYCGKSRVAL